MTTVEIPTSLCVTVAAYVAGAYIFGVVMGWKAPRYQDEADEFDWFIMVFWPFAVLIDIIAGFPVACRFTAKRFPRVAKWIGRVWYVLTFSFRPWRIGRLLRERSQK